MSLYGDILDGGDGRAASLPTGVASADCAASDSSASSPTVTTATGVSATASAAAPLKPHIAFAAAPRSLATSRVFTGLTPAQRAMQIQAAAARSAANLAAQQAAQPAHTHTTTNTNPTPPLASSLLPTPSSSSLFSSPSLPPPPAAAASSASLSDDEEDDSGPLAVPIANEYDPRRPNEYEQYIQLREARRRKEEAEAEERRQARRGGGRDNEERAADREYGRGNERDAPHHTRPPPDRDTAYPPPPPPSSSFHVPPSVSASSGSPAFSGVLAPSPGAAKLDLKVASGEDAYARRLALSRNMVNTNTNITKAQPFVSGGSINTPDAIGTPPAPAATNPLDSSSGEKRPRLDSSPLGVPSRVLLLLNMVSRGEVDDDLESETADECARFGRVLKATVFEVPDPSTPVEEAVRIFIKFEALQAAQKAANELNGRYFGGRRVVARYVDESKFNKGQLAP